MQRKWLIAIPIILVLVALCACMVGIAVLTVRRADGLTLYLDGLRVLDTPAEAEESYDFSAPDPAALVVTNDCGEIEVSSQEGEQITVTAHKKAWGANQADAEARLAQIELDLTQDGDTVKVGIKNPEQVCRNQIGRPAEITFRINVPPRTRVKATTQLGGISLRGTRLGAELHSSFGDVSARDLEGGLVVETQNGRVEAVSVDAGKEPITLQTAFGDIHLENAAASKLETTTQNGKVELEKVDISGDSRISSNFGDLSWLSGKTRALDLQSQNGQITLQGVKASGALTASTDFGDIHINDVEAESYQATTLNGKIEIDGAQGQVKAHSDFGDINVTHANEVTFDLKSKNGQLHLQGTLGKGPHQAITDFGDIQMEFPAGTVFDFDLQTQFGTVDIDAGGDPNAYSIQGKPDGKHWKGKAYDGGPLITATTQNGNITIRLEENTSQ